MTFLLGETLQSFQADLGDELPDHVARQHVHHVVRGARLAQLQSEEYVNN